MPDTYYYYTDATQLRVGKWKGISTVNLDAVQLEDASRLAYERINLVLARTYPVPFAVDGSAPGIIGQIAELLTVAYAKAYTGGHSRDTKGPWKDFEGRAEAWLKELVALETIIPGVTPLVAGGGLSSTTLGESRTFQSDDPHSWTPSPLGQTRIADDRAEE